MCEFWHGTGLEAVEYLPQALVERICNSDPTSEHRDAFENELKRVIFCHIPRAEREGQLDLDGLLALRSKSITVAVRALRDEIQAETESFIDLEKRSWELVSVDIQSRLEALYESRKLVQIEIEASVIALKSASDSADVLNPHLIADRKRIVELDAEIASIQALDQLDTQSMADASRRMSELDSLTVEIEGIHSQVRELNERVSAILGRDEALVELHVDRSKIELGRSGLAQDIAQRVPLENRIG